MIIIADRKSLEDSIPAGAVPCKNCGAYKATNEGICTRCGVLRIESQSDDFETVIVWTGSMKTGIRIAPQGIITED